SAVTAAPPAVADLPPPPASPSAAPPASEFDDEPTQPPAPGAEPPERLHAALTARLRADEPVASDAVETGTFAGGFQGTLAELAPDGAALDGPLGVFSMLPPDAANELARRAIVKPFDGGEVVVREGDTGDACYVIARGEVVVTRRGADGEPPVELARLGEGALFGEFAILADRRRHATVTALGDAEIYVIPRLLLRELAAIYPDVGPALDRFYRERLLANLIHTSPLFARLAVDQRAGLLSAFEPMRVESGHAIVRQGERAGGLFLIVLGAVEVVARTDDRRAVVLATLGEGAYVGEISLLSGEVATASVIACGPVELAALPASSFYRVVAEYPELWAAMRDEASARRLRTAGILAGRTGVV
ncbi:MAG TPA: cyclic nucleotide-binding domain-containing protein, partial [Kofleriaceae bacterium]|nr:cyclic nucleotide-binding domain-containing protein [Kofleriaceae bacterium]